jgi:hypothetical protein
MDNRLAQPKGFIPPGSSVSPMLNLTKTYYSAAQSPQPRSPREQSPEQALSQSFEKSLGLKAASPYAQKEKTLEKLLHSTITQTPKRVEPPFGILELPRFD